MASRGINNPDQTLIKHHILGRTGLNDRLESQGRSSVFQEKAFKPAQKSFDLFETLFVFYKNFFDLKIVTDPFVEGYAAFTTQFQLLNPETDLYKLSYLLPIKQLVKLLRYYVYQMNITCEKHIWEPTNPA